jgi:hypothetical protein
MSGVRDGTVKDMSEPFVPTDFEVPLTFDGPGFHLEPLHPVHNERDYQAWMSSIEHIKATPGMEGRMWPRPMTLHENMADMEMHAKEFTDREGFTYSILDGDIVIGCVYIQPAKDDHDAAVRSWVTESDPRWTPLCGRLSAIGSQWNGRLATSSTQAGLDA